MDNRRKQQSPKNQQRTDAPPRLQRRIDQQQASGKTVSVPKAK